MITVVTVVTVVDLLRHSAEQTLVDMLESLFSRLPQLSSDTSSSTDMTSDQVLMLPNEGTIYKHCANSLYKH